MERIDKAKKVGAPTRATVWYVASGVFGKACSIAVTPFFTRLLSPEEYGSFTMYMTVLGGVSILCSAFSSGSAVYSGFEKFKHSSRDFCASTLSVSLGFSPTVCILLFAFLPFFSIPSVLFIPICLQVLCDSAVAVFYSYSRYNYRYISVCILTLISYAVPPMISLTVLSLRGGGYAVRVASLLLVSMFLASFSLFSLLKGGSKARKNMQKQLIRTAAPLLPHCICGAVIAQADKLTVGAILGAGELAKYSVAYSIGISVMFIVNSVSGALNPWIVRRLGANQTDKIGELFSPIFILCCLAALYISAISPEAISLLAPDDYGNAAYSVMPISLSCLPSFITSVSTVGLVYSEKGKYTVLLSVIGSVCCVGVGIICVYLFGIIGASISILITQSVCSVFAIYFLKKSGIGSMISAVDCMSAVLFSLIYGCILLLLFPFPAIRILLLIPPTLYAIGRFLKTQPLVAE